VKLKPVTFVARVRLPISGLNCRILIGAGVGIKTLFFLVLRKLFHDLEAFVATVHKGKQSIFVHDR